MFVEVAMRVKHPIRTNARVVFKKAPVEAQPIVTQRYNLSCVPEEG